MWHVHHHPLRVVAPDVAQRARAHDVRVADGLHLVHAHRLGHRVEGGEELLSLDNLENLLPLGLSGVDSSWVVGTDVEHDNGVVLSGVKVFLQALEVEALGLLAVVAVILPFVADEVSDCSMDGPGGVGDTGA